MEKNEEIPAVMIDNKQPDVAVGKCPECGSTNIIHDHETKEIVCGDCGIVLGQEMAKGPERRAFTQEEKASRSHVGKPTSYSSFDKCLSTDISQMDRDAFGRKLPMATRLQMWRLRKWQIRTRVHYSADRNLAQAMNELARLVDKVDVKPPIKEKAAIIYRKALDKGTVRGRSIAAIVAAALYAACRATGTSRTLREIAEASLTDKIDVARCYRTLLEELEIKIPPPDPILYISKIAEKVGISGKTQGLAIQLLRDTKKKLAHSGKDPMGMAAAALYIACLLNKENKTQRDLADVIGMTDVTIRTRYNTIKDALKLENV